MIGIHWTNSLRNWRSLTTVLGSLFQIRIQTISLVVNFTNSKSGHCPAILSQAWSPLVQCSRGGESNGCNACIKGHRRMVHTSWSFSEIGHYFLAKEIFMAWLGVILNPCNESRAAADWTSFSNSTKAISWRPGTKRTSLKPGNLVDDTKN